MSIRILYPFKQDRRHIRTSAINDTNGTISALASLVCRGLNKSDSVYAQNFYHCIAPVTLPRQKDGPEFRRRFVRLEKINREYKR